MKNSTLLINLAVCGMVLLFGQHTKAQSTSALGSPEIGYIDMTHNVFSAMHYYNMVDSKKQEQLNSNTLLPSNLESRFATSNKNVLTFERASTDGSMLLPDYFIIKDFRGEIKVAYTIFQGEKYSLVCKKKISSICDCGEDLAIYITDENRLINVQKPFSLSVKNNLIAKLNKYLDFDYSKKDFDNQCDFIKKITN